MRPRPPLPAARPRMSFGGDAAMLLDAPDDRPAASAESPYSAVVLPRLTMSFETLQCLGADRAIDGPADKNIGRTA